MKKLTFKQRLGMRLLNIPQVGSPEAKASETSSAVYSQTLGQPAWTPRDYEKLAKESYMMNVVAYACVRRIATEAATVPWKFYKGDKEDKDSPAERVLRRPSPTESGDELMERFYSFLQLSGNGYLEGVTLDGQLEEIYAHRPERMKVIPGRNGRPLAYTYEVNGRKTRFDFPKSSIEFNPILHQKMFHPLNDHYGMSPIEAIAFSIDNHNESVGYSKSLLQNMARPSGALKVTTEGDSDGKLTEDQFDSLKKELNEQYSGQKNAGKPMLLEGGLEWQQMSLDMQELNFTEQQRETARAIALGMGVPPQLLGIPGDSTYANYKEANIAFYRQTVLPLVRKTSMSLSNWLMPIYGDDFMMSADIDKVEALSPERDAVWARTNSSTMLSLGEKREVVGYGPVSELDKDDVLLVPSGLTPLDELGFEGGGPEPEEENDDDES